MYRGDAVPKEVSVPSTSISSHLWWMKSARAHVSSPCVWHVRSGVFSFCSPPARFLVGYRWFSAVEPAVSSFEGKCAIISTFSSVCLVVCCPCLWCGGRHLAAFSLSETEKGSQKVLEPTRKPKVIYIDNSLEFGNSCEDLSWNHCTSTPHRSETNGIAERAVRRVKEGTSAVLMQSDLNENWWQIPWNAIPICETFKISCLMGRRPMKDVLGNQLKDLYSIWFIG